jgi:predicted AlkP superfamily phosphohydrolase/phosphomutase/tetratricopeptide (TPR) repeat protein
MTRLLLVGWDAADWKIIDPLLARGEMPNLARVLGAGVRGTLATISPPLSPMVWTSIATGKRPAKHGIHGFTEPTEDGLGLRPVSNLGRTAKAIWNILNQNGKRAIVAGWWPSHPAEPIAGGMVSDLFPLDANDPADKPLPAGAVHPPERASALAELRVHATEISPEILSLFVPRWREVDQAEDRSLFDLAGIIAETMSIHNAATELMETESWDLAAVYYSGIDHFSHRFMRYHAGKRVGPDHKADPALFRDIVRNAYRYHDLMLGRLLALAGEDCAVLVLSDHGFHSDAMLPDHIPAEAAGPAVEHREFGIFCLRAPGVRAGEHIHGASVLDIAPTVLQLFGLPAGADMDGKVLLNAFTDSTLPARIPSWEDVPGADGRHPPDRRFDPAAAVDTLAHLVDLGYVAPQGADAAQAVRECLVENRYNLARAHLDAGETAPAIALLEALLAEDPEQLRTHQHLIRALVAERRFATALRRLDALDGAAPDIARRAAEDLRRRRAETPDKELTDARAGPARREMFERRALSEKFGGYAFDRMILRASVLLARARPADREQARPLLNALAARRRWRRPLALFLAQGFAALGEAETAMGFLQRLRRLDRDNWRALALEARLHARTGRWKEATERAAHSLSLMFAQPALHHLLGVALLREGEAAAAEREFRVALAEAPGFAAAHRALAQLLRRDPARQVEAAVSEARAAQARAHAPPPPAAEAPPVAPAPFERLAPLPAGGRAGIVTVVAGLPRSGTSMMMQMLAAGGVAPFTDGARVADADNARGYFEHERAAGLHRDVTWLPAARGLAVKIVAPLLPYLPARGAYRIVFMHRALGDSVASQRAMLARLRRTGGRQGDAALAQAFAGQLARVRAWLEQRADIPVLAIDYAATLADPRRTAVRLADFLGPPFDLAAAAAAVAPELRRQRAAE